MQKWKMGFQNRSQPRSRKFLCVTELYFLFLEAQFPPNAIEFLLREIFLQEETETDVVDQKAIHTRTRHSNRATKAWQRSIWWVITRQMTRSPKFFHRHPSSRWRILPPFWTLQKISMFRPEESPSRCWSTWWSAVPCFSCSSVAYNRSYHCSTWVERKSSCNV